MTASDTFNIVLYGDIKAHQISWFSSYLIPILFGDISLDNTLDILSRKPHYNQWVRVFFKEKYLDRGGRSIFETKNGQFVVSDSTLLSLTGKDKLPYFLVFLRRYVYVHHCPLTILTNQRNANELAKWAYALSHEGVTKIAMNLSEGVPGLTFVERNNIDFDYYISDYTPSTAMHIQQIERRRYFKRAERETQDDDRRSVRQCTLSLSDRVNESIVSILPENPYARSAPILTSDGIYVHGSDLVNDPSICPGLLSDDISPLSGSDSGDDEPDASDNPEVPVPVVSPLPRAEDEANVSSHPTDVPLENTQLVDDSDTDVDGNRNHQTLDSQPLLSASTSAPAMIQSPLSPVVETTPAPVVIQTPPETPVPLPSLVETPLPTTTIPISISKEESVRREINIIAKWFRSPTTPNGYVLTTYTDLENYLCLKGNLGDKVLHAVTLMLSVYHMHKDIFERPAYWYELRRYFGERRESPTETEVVWSMIPKLYAIYKLRKLNRRFNMSVSFLGDIYRCVSRDSVKEFLENDFLPSNTRSEVCVHTLYFRYNQWRNLPPYFLSSSVIINRLLELYNGLVYNHVEETITGLPYIINAMVRVIVRRKLNVERVFFVDPDNINEEWRPWLNTDYRVSDSSVFIDENSTEYTHLLSHSLSTWDGPVVKNLLITFNE